MPSLGADMDSGTIVEWRVAPGEAVHRGDIVAVVDTDKADIEVEVFEDGVVEELLVAPGQEVQVGTPLARIGALPEAAGAAPARTAAKRPERTRPAEPAKVPEPVEAARPRKAARATKAARTAPPARPAAAREPGTRVRATPLARRRAAEAGLDLGSVAGTGPDGAVVAADLGPATAPAAAPAAPAAAAPRAGRDRAEAMRLATGELMARSKREIPHYYLAQTVDLAAAMAWLQAANEHRPPVERLLPAALLLKATALAARKVPNVNGTWDGGFVPAEAVHLGVAISLRGGGLVAPAIHDADGRSLEDLMSALRDLVERARAGRLRASEMADPTITVTNLGDQGADEVLGVIYPPQVALVGFGRIVDRPWAAGGMLGVRATVRASLAADHRVTDGHEGSRFLGALAALLQNPEAL
jgi:pyruvate dehydrogenase E2 component (dihydrolipoamide acetyltransferase)